MKIYSDYPVRRTFQISADVLAIVAIGLGIWLGIIVTTAIAVLSDVGRQLELAGASFKGAMADAGEALGNVPFIGATVRVPFDTASGTGGALEDAGQSTQSFIEATAMIVGLVVSAVIVVAVCRLWLSRRMRFIRRATQAQRLAMLDNGADVLALRALIHGTGQDLALMGDRPVDAWRAGSQSVVAMLAELELRDAGVRIAR